MLPGNLAAAIDLTSWWAPPVFEWLTREGNVEEAEMLRALNCGVGMVAVVAADRFGDVLAALRLNGEDAFSLGTIEPRQAGEPVRYTGSLRFRG